MKKIRWATHKTLFAQIATSTCLLGGTAGLIFGISAGTFKINYFQLNDAQSRLKAANTTNFYSQNISSQWNMNEKGKPGDKDYIPAYIQPTNQYFISKPDDLSSEPTQWWKDLHGATSVPLYQNKYDINPSGMSLSTAPGTSISSDAQAMRKKYATLIIDGSTHTAMDRSFNQGLLNGLANFNTNIPHNNPTETEIQSYKPAQDSTQEFVNIYREAAKNTRILALAGFNHVTPLNALGEQKGNKVDFGTDERIKNAGMLLIDGDISNNQNVASILFRSDQPAFLTGVATCMYFLNNLQMYHTGYRDISVAAYGGTAIPTVTIYMGGFQRGIEFYNQFILREKLLHNDLRLYLTSGNETENLTKLITASKYKAELEQLKATKPAEQVLISWENKMFDEFSVKMIRLGDFSTHFTGSFASGDAIGISKQLLNRGASAIIAVAGPQSLDTAQEIMNQNSNCIVIGVDSAMENSDYQKPYKERSYTDQTKAPDNTVSSQASNIIKFSAVKDMTSVSEKIFRNASSGKNWDVTNDRPWKSTSQIPLWNPAEVIPMGDLAFVFNKDQKTFDVIGFLNAPSWKNAHVLEIPSTYEKDGTIYNLNAIRQPTDAEKKAEPKIVEASFNAESLKDIHTLKINGDSTNTKLTLDKNAFNFSIKGLCGDEKPVTSEDLKESGFKYVDLTGVGPDKLNVAKNALPFKGIIFDDSSFAYNKGIVKLNPEISDQNQKGIVLELFNNGSGQMMNWPIKEADPYKSICSFGFKTCGNIENGLISISWDGWAFLIEALKELKYIDSLAESPSEITFDAMWQKSADQYYDEHESEKELKDFLVAAKTATWNGAGGTPILCTFNRESIFYKNYSHTMAILGRFLNRAQLVFPKEMTVVFDKTGKPHAPEGNEKMSVLEWLKNNMYFTC